MLILFKPFFGIQPLETRVFKVTLFYTFVYSFDTFEIPFHSTRTKDTLRRVN